MRGVQEKASALGARLGLGWENLGVYRLALALQG